MLVELNSSALWRLPKGVALSWRNWDDEFVVFSNASGETHVLDAFSAWVLQKIEASPSTVNVLLTHLTRELGPPEDEQTDRMSAILTEFENLGLAERSQIHE